MPTGKRPRSTENEEASLNERAKILLRRKKNKGGKKRIRFLLLSSFSFFLASWHFSACGSRER
jgi:hypothetical protein